jgi:hypothetical protein
MPALIAPRRPGPGPVTFRGTFPRFPLSISEILATTPYLWWRLGANGLVDQSGNSRDGSANGGVSVGGIPGLIQRDTDTATFFDGVDDYGRVSSGVHQLPQVSVMLVFSYAAAPASQKTLAGFIDGPGGGSADKDLYLESTGKVTWDCYDGTEKFITTTNALSTGAPHVLIGTADGSNIRLYVDGVEAATPTACGNVFTGYTVPNIFVSGSQASRGFMSFAGDEFAVWNYALTADRISLISSILLGPRTVTQSIAPTVTSTATIARQTGKAVTATATSTASIAKQVAKPVTATATSTASVTKRVNKPVTATATSSATLTKRTNKSITATATSTASLVRSVAKSILATVTSSVTTSRRTNKNVSATATSSATVTKRVNKNVTATVSSTANLSATRVVLQTITAAVSATASIAKRVDKTVAANVSTEGSVVRSITKTISAALSTLAEVLTEYVAAPTLTYDFTFDPHLLAQFHEGTEVGIYEGEPPLPGEEPPSDPVASATVTDALTVSLFAGRYYLGVQVPTLFQPARGYAYEVLEWRFVSFTVP